MWFTTSNKDNEVSQKYYFLLLFLRRASGAGIRYNFAILKASLDKDLLWIFKFRLP